MLLSFFIFASLTACTQALRKATSAGAVDRSKEQETFSYRNVSYDWLLQHRVTRWINRPLWKSGIQPGVVQTEKGWGLLAFDGGWLREPRFGSVLRVVKSPGTSYPERVFAKLKDDDGLYLVDSDGKWIGNFDTAIDPYEAINRVKKLRVYYVREYGSVFSVKPNSDYESNTDLASYTNGRFRSVDWNVFEPPGDCQGWIVRLKGKNTQIFRQQWLVTTGAIYQLPAKNFDHIKTSASYKKTFCVKRSMARTTGRNNG